MSLHIYFLLYCGQLFVSAEIYDPICIPSAETLEHQDIDLDKELKSFFLLTFYCFGNTFITHYK